MSSLLSLFVGGSNTKLDELQHIPDRGVYIMYKGWCQHNFQRNTRGVQCCSINRSSERTANSFFLQYIYKRSTKDFFRYIVYANGIFKLVNSTWCSRWLLIYFITRTSDQNPEHLPEHPTSKNPIIEVDYAEKKATF